MDKFLNLMTIDNVAEGIKRAYEKYKTANSTFWVTSLSFYTIVALVPIAAILFSLGSWFGAKDYIIHQITETTPLPMEVLELISTFAENLLKNARSGLLAGIGFLFLGWTFIKMFSLIEDSFNDIWHIKIPRTFVRKISDYVAFFIFLPLVFIIINGATILLLSKIESISILHQLLSKIVPYTSLLVFLSALYIIMPNTTVKVVPALASAFVISIIFSIFQFTFIHIQILINNYNSVYGGFSVIFIFLLWIRVFWFFIILGVHLSYLLQNASFDVNLESENTNISFNSKLYITLKIFEILVKKYIDNNGATTFEDLKTNIKSSPFLIENILEDLLKNSYIISGYDSNNEKIYSILKNIDEVNLKEIYDFTATTGSDIFLLCDKTQDNIEKIIVDRDYERNLRSLGGK